MSSELSRVALGVWLFITSLVMVAFPMDWACKRAPEIWKRFLWHSFACALVGLTLTCGLASAAWWYYAELEWEGPAPIGQLRSER